MIILATAPYQDFIDFLNKRYPTDKQVIVTIIPQYTSIAAPDGTMCFAAYDPKHQIIYVAGANPDDIPAEHFEEFVCTNLAHEYCHHLQWADGKSFDEKQAEDFAYAAYDLFYMEG